jgi:hypothetical protein
MQKAAEEKMRKSAPFSSIKKILQRFFYKGNTPQVSGRYSTWYSVYK